MSILEVVSLRLSSWHCNIFPLPWWPGIQCTCTSCPPAWGSARTRATGRAWWSSTARGWASARQASSATTRCYTNTEMLMNNSNKIVYKQLGLGDLVDSVPSGAPPLHSLCCWPGKQTFLDKSVNKYKWCFLLSREHLLWIIELLDTITKSVQEGNTINIYLIIEKL